VEISFDKKLSAFTGLASGDKKVVLSEMLTDLMSQQEEPFGTILRNLTEDLLSEEEVLDIYTTILQFVCENSVEKQQKCIDRLEALRQKIKEREALEHSEKQSDQQAANSLIEDFM